MLKNTMMIAEEQHPLSKLADLTYKITISFRTSIN